VLPDRFVDANNSRMFSQKKKNQKAFSAILADILQCFAALVYEYAIISELKLFEWSSSFEKPTSNFQSVT
jgi:hypothetical protein